MIALFDTHSLDVVFQKDAYDQICKVPKGMEEGEMAGEIPCYIFDRTTSTRHLAVECESISGKHMVPGEWIVDRYRPATEFEIELALEMALGDDVSRSTDLMVALIELYTQQGVELSA